MAYDYDKERADQVTNLGGPSSSLQLPCATCPNPPSCAEYGGCQLRNDAPSEKYRPCGICGFSDWLKDCPGLKNDDGTTCAYIGQLQEVAGRETLSAAYWKDKEAAAQHDLERAVANHAADLSAASATAAMWAGKGPDGAGPVKRSVAAFGDTLRGMRLSDWEHDRIMEFVIEQYRVIEKLERRRPDNGAKNGT
jgi:hypothetical protein